MSSIREEEKEAASRERTIRALTNRAGAPLERVRDLFAEEFARLGRGARVRNFLHVLTTSNVRAMLRPPGKGHR
jgi:Protein of unknown function (DUF3562)